MAKMSWSEQVKLAFSLGATFELGSRWKFPTEESKQEFLRKSTGMEWTQQQKDVADAALLAHHARLRAAGAC